MVDYNLLRSTLGVLTQTGIGIEQILTILESGELFGIPTPQLQVDALKAKVKVEGAKLEQTAGDIEALLSSMD